jgi:hypothetical protein
VAALPVANPETPPKMRFRAKKIFTHFREKANTLSLARVTRFDEFSPIGWLFTPSSFFMKNYLHKLPT